MTEVYNAINVVFTELELILSHIHWKKEIVPKREIKERIFNIFNIPRQFNETEDQVPVKPLQTEYSGSIFSYPASHIYVTISPADVPLLFCLAPWTSGGKPQSTEIIHIIYYSKDDLRNVITNS